MSINIHVRRGFKPLAWGLNAKKYRYDPVAKKMVLVAEGRVSAGGVPINDKTKAKAKGVGDV
jgi:hypothetical protein